MLRLCYIVLSLGLWQWHFSMAVISKLLMTQCLTSYLDPISFGPQLWRTKIFWGEILSTQNFWSTTFFLIKIFVGPNIDKTQHFNGLKRIFGPAWLSPSSIPACMYMVLVFILPETYLRAIFFLIMTLPNPPYPSPSGLLVWVLFSNDLQVVKQILYDIRNSAFAS